MPAVNVVHAPEVEPFASPGGLSVRVTLGPRTDFDALHQAVLECGRPGRARRGVGPRRRRGDPVRARGRGQPAHPWRDHAIGADIGIYLPPGSETELHNTGSGPLRLVAVRVPDPSPGPPMPASVSRLDDQDAQQATTEREFRIVADPATGLRSATHFVGYIPPERAPDHFHTYDEVIYVLDGEGVMAGRRLFAAGEGRLVHPATRPDGALPVELGQSSRCASSPCSGPPDRRRPPSIRTEPPPTRAIRTHSRGGANRL